MDTRTAQKLTDDVLSIIVKGKFSSDDGATWFEGESLSHLIACLRDMGWTRIGNAYDFEYHTLRKLGFKCVQARAANPHGKSPCKGKAHNVITVV